jgi:hypothetical protein
MPQTVVLWPQGMVLQLGRSQDTQAPALLHWSPSRQVPQLMVPPHPSETEPQVRLPQAAAWVAGVQQLLL